MVKRSEYFSNVDAAWLHMETPTNMAMITGVITFDGVVPFVKLQQVILQRFLIFDRFVKRVREPSTGLGLPRWEIDPEFDLNYHIQRVHLPEPADQRELENLVGDLMSTQLDFSRPLWQFHYIDNYNGGSALIGRLHHCIADGLALIQVLLTITDDCPDAPCPAPAPPSETQKLSKLARLLVPPIEAGRKVQKTYRKVEKLVGESLETIVHPTRFLHAARLGRKGTRALGKLLLIGPDQPTLYKGRCCERKRASWSTPIPLEDVKVIGRLMGGTVNDVLLSATTGALRRYLESRGQVTDGVDIRAVVPVNLRQEGDLYQLGNRFGLVFLSLPIGIRDPIRRLITLKRRMDSIKNSPEAVVAFGILNAIGMTPIQIERIIVGIFGMKGTAVMTNVPGPRAPIYMAGKRIRDLMFWVPQPGNLGMGVSIISYAGGVVLGVATDTGLVPDPETLIAYFYEELEHLKRWGRPVETVNIREEEYQPPYLTQEFSPEIITGDANDHCTALTRRGTPCKNKALPGQKTCWNHRRQEPVLASD